MSNIAFLLREAAAEAGIHLPLADYFAGVLDRAKEAGFAGEDWAVGQYRIAQSIASQPDASQSDATHHASKARKE